jgi:hypothetical protein
MRLKHQSRSSRSGDACGATLSVIADGRYLNYYPGSVVLAAVSQWPNGALLEWDLDDLTRRPRGFYLVQASARGGLTLRKRPQQRPHFAIPTSQVGIAEHSTGNGSQAVEDEVISDTETHVNVPFTFASTVEADTAAE